MRNADLEIDAAECPLCLEAGFSAGSEFFDPLVLPHLPLFAKFPEITWRIHLHNSALRRYYFVQMLFAVPSPGSGFMQFDGPMDEDPKIAVEHALVEARRGIGSEEA